MKRLSSNLFYRMIFGMHVGYCAIKFELIKMVSWRPLEKMAAPFLKVCLLAAESTHH